MVSSNIFKCGKCGEICDIDERKENYTGDDGKKHYRTTSEGYNELRLMNYGSRATSKTRMCSACLVTVVKTLGIKPEWEEWSD